MNTNLITRRDFLKYLTITGGGILLAGCRSQPLTPCVLTVTMTPESDIIREPSATPSSLPGPTATSTITPAPAMEVEYLPKMAAGETFTLPLPLTDGGMPLMQALLNRHSERTFSQQELPVQVLVNLLWAGFGVNRPQTGGRTAPSAYDFQDIDIYLATAKGLFHYEAGSQCLIAILSDDVRPFTGVQAFVATVPVNLVYVSDYSRMASASVEDREHWSWAHSGFIAQNVYLACASEGLATVVRSTINRAQLANRMGLNENQHIILAQSIGYPAA